MLFTDPITPSDVALTIDFLLSIALVLIFAFGSRGWRSDPLGWVIVYYGLAVVALLGLIVYAVLFGQKIVEPVRLIVAVALGWALIWKTHAIIAERRAGRRERMRAAPVNPQKES